jgi:hypothetical protein
MGTSLRPLCGSSIPARARSGVSLLLSTNRILNLPLALREMKDVWLLACVSNSRYKLCGYSMYMVRGRSG